METIAFLGLGHMGAPMARRLLDAGHPTTVWNRTEAKAAPLTEAGARPAADPADAVRGADVVITMLAGPAALDAVAAQVAPELAPGTHWIDMSTVGPDAVRALAERVPTGVTVLDCPVLGSTDKAASGELKLLAGGDPTPVEALLARLGTVTRTGPPGSGAALKLVLNTAVVGGVAVVAEALALAGSLGVADDVAEAALRDSHLAGAAHRALATDVHFDVELAVKDVSLATGAARLPVMEAVGRQLADTGPEFAHRDLAEAVTHIRERHS
ncbi:NAD(P)-dependent oxidoreductase [Streptomyces triticagri]|uniref:NAD(P)-dependent oxidoreductase n=1 Tax=Streptomyces triticagri TaxID=2293568 RepID=A0A372M4J6_9ACTN|nr:NAD(P)-dependent oxidoreductase [Streptomyces triticagri]RFU85858.1 NAD(P)-dependent oxidoreductase [Streptomyces triticagri]